MNSRVHLTFSDMFAPDGPFVCRKGTFGAGCHSRASLKTTTSKKTV